MTVPELLELLANRHHLAGELDAARGYYVQALSAEPGNASASFALGVLELQAGHFPAAIERMQRAIAASHPVPPRFYFGLGKVYAGMNRHHEAALEFGRALASEPRWAEMRLRLGAQQTGDGRFARGDRRVSPDPGPPAGFCRGTE